VPIGECRKGKRKGMKGPSTAILVCLICFSCLAVPVAAAGGVGVDPATITGTLKPGETQNAQITVTLPGSVPKGDVVFAFDTTGSMSRVSEAMKIQGIQVMDDIRAVIPDTRFGVASFMDYPGSYPNFYDGYKGTYGEDTCGATGPGYANDYPYLLQQELTPDITLAHAGIEKIPRGCGGDWPEDYARVVYESLSYQWRSDAKKIYVIFGDAPPHAEPNGSTLEKPWAAEQKLFTRPEAPYGGDPGRDGVAYTEDDIDYKQATADVAAGHITIAAVYYPNNGQLDDQHADAENNFRYMAYVTGGLFVVSNPEGDPSDIAAQIVSMIQEMAEADIRELGLQVKEPGFTGWMTAPAPYRDVPWPSTKVFNVAIKPPAGTADGDYTFHIDVVGDGVVLGTVAVTEHVKSDRVVTPIKISLDIKPGDCPNSFNIKEKGVLPVAILGSRDLKASSIDPKSIVLTRYGGANGVKPIRTSLDDVASASTKTCSCGFKSGRPDRKQDLTLKFDSQDVVKKLGIKKNEGCIRVTVTGTIRSKDPALDGQRIQGSDYLRVLDNGSGPCGGGDSKGGKGSSDERDRNPWDDNGPDDRDHGNDRN
jgi:hypothetical protein